MITKIRTALLFTVLLVGISGGISGCISKDLRAPGPDSRADKSSLLIADRGAATEAPENTMAAFDKAQAEGALTVFIDAQLSKDGKVVLFRDLSPTEKTGLTGTFATRSWSELSKIDLAKWFADKNPTPAPLSVSEAKKEATVTASKQASSGRTLKKKPKSRRAKIAVNQSLTRLTTLDDVFEKYGLTFQYYVVLATNDDKLANAVSKLVHEYGIQSNALITSVDHEQLTRLHQADTSVALCYLIDERSRTDINGEIQRSVNSGFQQIGLRGSVITSDFIKRADALKIKVIAYDLDSPDTIARAAKTRASGLVVPSTLTARPIVEEALAIRY